MKQKPVNKREILRQMLEPAIRLLRGGLLRINRTDILQKGISLTFFTSLNV